MTKFFQIREKTLRYDGPDDPRILVYLPFGQGESDFPEQLQRALAPGLRDFSPGMVFFPVSDWNRELSPWNASPVFGKEPFGSGAEETLDFLLHQALPTVEASFPKKPKGPEEERPRILCGYSMAGLFALWAGFRTDRFSRIGGISPSVWFPGWTDLVKTRPFLGRRVYLSLGNTEEKTRNPVLAKVGAALTETGSALREQNIPCLLEYNEGNHFKDPAGRTAKGILALLSELS